VDVAQAEATSEVAITGRATPEAEVVAVEEVVAVDMEAVVGTAEVVGTEVADMETVETSAMPLGNSFRLVVGSSIG